MHTTDGRGLPAYLDVPQLEHARPAPSSHRPSVGRDLHCQGGQFESRDLGSDKRRMHACRKRGPLPGTSRHQEQPETGGSPQSSGGTTRMHPRMERRRRTSRRAFGHNHTTLAKVYGQPLPSPTVTIRHRSSHSTTAKIHPE